MNIRIRLITVSLLLGVLFGTQTVGIEKAYGLVILTESAEKLNDLAILSTSLLDLGEEVGVSVELLRELESLRQEVRSAQDQLYLTREIYQEAYGLGHPEIGGATSASENIDSVTRYIRQAKRMMNLLLRMTGRPETVTAVTLLETNKLLLSLLQTQEREAVKREREGIRTEREKRATQIAVTKFIDDEFKKVKRHSSEHSKPGSQRGR